MEAAPHSPAAAAAAAAAAGGTAGAAAQRAYKGRARGRTAGAAAAAAAAAAAEEEEDEEVLSEPSSESEGDDDNEAGGAWRPGRPRWSMGSLRLKPDHAGRPLWAFVREGLVEVFLETFSPLYRQAYDFLIAIADPISRPEFVHEYKITEYSLYAATSLGLRSDDIVETLERLSKVELTAELRQIILTATQRCGRVRLAVRKSRYFVESVYVDTLSRLYAHDAIRACALRPADSVALDRQQAGGGDGALVVDEETGFLVARTLAGDADLVLPGTGHDRAVDQEAAMGMGMGDRSAAAAAAAAAASTSAAAVSAAQKHRPVYSFEVEADKVERVKQITTTELKYPMLEEYDFRHDGTARDLPALLKPSTQIRDYQEKSLSKMFGNGRARSGIIVLPCGAGKTLVGITAMSTIRKSTLIFCTTGMAVHQWKRQIQQWAVVPDNLICLLTKDNKDKIPRGGAGGVVLITTYSMVSFSGRRSAQTAEIMEFIRTNPWGLVLLDEVQVAPAAKFRTCISQTQSFCKLGLTATLVREDSGIDDLFFLIGPKLYEANWLDLQAAGNIATVQCIELWCPMPEEFYREYLVHGQKVDKQRLLYTMNPTKLRYCEYLIKKHSERGDKVLIFSDSIFAIEEYSRRLNVPKLYGSTGDTERNHLLRHFQSDPTMNCLIISKVGDNSIDLPDVNVIIQISSHFAARRQEAQRLGRILRPKARTGSKFNAFFYTLVSKDTREMFYATKRQRFLVDQGYSFEVVSDFDARMEKGVARLMTTQDERKDLLARALSVEDYGEEVLDENGRAPAAARRVGNSRMDDDDDDDDVADNNNGDDDDKGGGAGGPGAGAASKARRTVGNAADISGASGIVYDEVVGDQQKKRKKGAQSELFKKRERELKKRARMEQ